MVRVFSMEKESRRILADGAKIFGIDMDRNGVDAFERYLRELLKWNQKINLTAIRTERGILLKHFLDSLSAHPYLSDASTLLDIGSGAGFPGIPLKMVNPGLGVTLIDSVQKKVDFQRHVIRTLHLKGIEAIHGRVQDQEFSQRLKERFDVIISRAFSDLSALLMLSQPFLKKGGKVLAMKGKGEGEKIPFSSRREEASFHLQKSITFILPFSSFERTIFLFEKE